MRDEEEGGGAGRAGRVADGGNGQPAGDIEREAESEAEVLLSLARLDLEAADAYAAAAARVDDDGVRAVLERFRDDHVAHLDDFDALMGALGPVPREAVGRTMLARLTATAAALGDDVTILALLGNEQLTNRSYEVALEIDWDDRTREVLERHMDDEQRHLSWLSDVEDQMWSDADDAPAGEAAPPGG